MSIARKIILLLVTIVIVACDIKDEMSDPIVYGQITEFEVEGQCGKDGGEDFTTVIDNEKREITLYVNDTVDIKKLRIKKITLTGITYNPDVDYQETPVLDVDSTQCSNYSRFPKNTFSTLDPRYDTRVDFCKPVKFVVTTYQDYEWTVNVTQIATRAIEAENQVEKAPIAQKPSNDVVFAKKKQKSNELKENKITLGEKNEIVSPDSSKVEHEDISETCKLVVKTGEDETPQNEEVRADSVERLHVGLEEANKKVKEQSYAESRGIISRDAMKTVFIPKGQWMVGGQVAWNQWDTQNMNYPLLKDLNFQAYTFSTGPYLGYFFRNNMAIGGRFSYKQYYLNLGEFDLNLGEDFNIGLEDIYFQQHNYESTVFLRSYLPIGKSKVFGLFGEVQLNYTFSKGLTSTGKGDTFSASYSSSHDMELGFAGGMAVFLTDYLATEVMLNVGGFHVNWGNQNTNNIASGSNTNSGANFRINLFSVKFGVTYYL